MAGKEGTEGTGSGGTTPPPAGDGTGGTGEGGTPPPKTFTQEQLDQIVQDRLSRAGKGKFEPGDFGFETKAEMEAAIKKSKDADEAAKSEQDKAVEKARKEGRQEAETELIGRANSRLMRSEFMLAAKERNVIDPQSLYLIAKAENRFDPIEVKDDDTVEGMTDGFWEELLKGRDFMVKAAEEGTGTPPGNVNSGTGSGKAKLPPPNRMDELKAKYPSLARRG